MSNYIPPSAPGYAAPASQDSGTVIQLSEPIYQARGWLKFLGVLSIIGGVISVLSIVGLISGGLSIWMGVLIYQAASAIEKAAQTGDRYSFLNSMTNLKTYFTIQGIMTLISVVMVVLVLCLIFIPLIFGFTVIPWDEILYEMQYY